MYTVPDVLFNSMNDLNMLMKKCIQILLHYSFGNNRNQSSYSNERTNKQSREEQRYK